MKRIPTRIKSFSGLGWSAVPSVQLAGGPTYHQIVINTNSATPENLAAADINYVRLLLNGDAIVELTGVQLDDLQKYKGLHTAAGVFVLPLGDKSANTLPSQFAGRLVTFPTDNLVLEVSIGAKGAHTDTLPTLNATAWVSASEPAREWLPRIRTLNYDASAVGVNSLTTLPRGPVIQRAHFLTDASLLRVLRDRINVFELSADDNSFNLQEWGRAPQPGYYHFDPVASGFDGADAFITAANELEFQLTVGTAGNIKVLLETIERVGAPAPTAA